MGVLSVAIFQIFIVTELIPLHPTSTVFDMLGLYEYYSSNPGQQQKLSLGLDIAILILFYIQKQIFDSEQYLFYINYLYETRSNRTRSLFKNNAFRAAKLLNIFAKNIRIRSKQRDSLKDIQGTNFSFESKRKLYGTENFQAIFSNAYLFIRSVFEDDFKQMKQNSNKKEDVDAYVRELKMAAKRLINYPGMHYLVNKGNFIEILNECATATRQRDIAEKINDLIDNSGEEDLVFASPIGLEQIEEMIGKGVDDPKKQGEIETITADVLVPEKEGSKKIIPSDELAVLLQPEPVIETTQEAIPQPTPTIQKQEVSLIKLEDVEEPDDKKEVKREVYLADTFVAEPDDKKPIAEQDPTAIVETPSFQKK